MLAPLPWGVRIMLRKLLLPALAAMLLAGCVTDYAYRGHAGRGDYYYGQPSVEYRYYGGYGYGGYYGYPYGAYGSWGYPYGYGAPYPYRYGYSPYYGYPRYRHYNGHPYRYDHDNRPHQGNRPYQGRPRNGGNGPWTGVDDLRRRIDQSAPPSSGAMPRSSVPQPTRSAPPRAMSEPRSGEPRSGGSRPTPRTNRPDRVREYER